MSVAARVSLTLLSRAYCHLCDDMAAALAPLAARFGVPVIVVDVDAHPALEARYGERVPVVLLGDEHAGAELCHHRLDPAAVTRALAAQQSSPSGG